MEPMEPEACFVLRTESPSQAHDSFDLRMRSDRSTAQPTSGRSNKVQLLQIFF